MPNALRCRGFAVQQDGVFFDWRAEQEDAYREAME